MSEVIEKEVTEDVDIEEAAKVIEIDDLLTQISKQRRKESKSPKKPTELDKLSSLIEMELRSQRVRLKPFGLHKLAELVSGFYQAPKKAKKEPKKA